MDALEFLRERKRMCNYYSNCEGCPLDESKCVIGSTILYEDCKRIAAAIEQWPEARIGDDGVLQIHPCLIAASHRNARGNCVTMGRKCPDCRREFWMQEVE